MYWRYWSTNLWLNLGWQLAHWRRRFALFWYGGDKTPWLFVSIAVFVVAALGFGLRSAIAYQDERRKRVREFHQQSLICLARNVYFEARGEPIEGQFAVAEAVYYQRYAPQLKGAVYFHATYIKPDWAPQKHRVAKIGRHIFYR